MLKKENRLTSIGNAAKNRISTPLFDLNTSNNNLSKSRFTFIISKKIDVRASVRNRTRRRIRSIIEEMLEKIVTGKDFVFYIKKNTVNLKRNEIYPELSKVFKNNKLIK